MSYKLISYDTKPSQTLRDSGADTVKIFETLEDANAMKNELNTITVDSVQWEVMSVEKSSDMDSKET